MNTRRRNLAIPLLLILLAPTSGQAIDVSRAESLLEGACREATRLPSLPDFGARLRALEAEDEKRSALDEYLARLTARMARRYAAGGLPAGGENVAACVAANPEARVYILMLDDPAYHRDSARQAP